MDLKAVFDLVDNRLVWHILLTTGVPERMDNLLARLYYGAESFVCIMGKDSDWFQVINGVKQGCVAVPNLFNCAINYIMLWVSQRILGVQLGNYQLSDLEDADDTTIFCESITNLESTLNIYHKETLNWVSNSTGQKPS